VFKPVRTGLSWIFPYSSDCCHGDTHLYTCQCYVHDMSVCAHINPNAQTFPVLDSEYCLFLAFLSPSEKFQRKRGRQNKSKSKIEEELTCVNRDVQ